MSTWALEDSNTDGAWPGLGTARLGQAPAFASA